MNFLRIVSLFTFVSIFCVVLVQIILTYNISAQLTGLFSNSHPNLRRKDNMLSITYLMPYIIFRQSQSQNNVADPTVLDELFGIYKQPVLDPNNPDLEAEEIEKVFLSYLRSTFLDKLLYPQFLEMSSTFGNHDIPSIEVEGWAFEPFDNLKANVLDLYINLNYILNKSVFIPKNYRDFRNIALKILSQQGTYLENNSSFEFLNERLWNISISTIIMIGILVIISTLTAFQITKSYFNWRIGLNFISAAKLKKKHTKTLLQIFPNIKVPLVKKKESEFIHKSLARNSYGKPSLSRLLRFMAPFLMIFWISIGVLATFIFYRVFLNINIIRQTGEVTTQFLKLDFFTMKALITMEDPLLPPLISGNEFQSEMVNNFASIFYNPQYGPEILKFFDIKADLCPELATRKFPYCTTMSKGVLKEGYLRLFNSLVYSIVQMLSEGKPYFSTPNHKELSKHIIAFIFANRIVRNKIQATYESIIGRYQTLSLFLIVLAMVFLLTMSGILAWLLQKRLIGPWSETIPLMMFVNNRAIQINPVLRQFLRGALM